MMDLNAAALFFCLCLSFIFFRSLRSPPTKNSCPHSYPIIGNLIALLRNRHRFHDWVADMLSRTPSLTLQVNTFLNASHGVCTANPLNVNHLLVSNFPNYIKGSRFHDFFHELLGDGIFNVDGHLWTVQRKISSHEFNTKSLKHFISDTVQSELSTRLIPFLSSACENNQVIDLQDVLRKAMFDNICNLAFGADPACLSSEAVGENSTQEEVLEGHCYKLHTRRQGLHVNSVDVVLLADGRKPSMRGLDLGGTIRGISGTGDMADPPYTPSIVLKMRGGLPVRVKRRRQPNAIDFC
ncbi:unnamed protein product, partial [Vitis vinifera]